MSYLMDGPSTGANQRSVSASPDVYQNTSGRSQLVVVQGGTVTTISYSTDGVTYIVVGLLAGMFTVRPGDYLRIAYILAPTVTVIG